MCLFDTSAGQCIMAGTPLVGGAVAVKPGMLARASSTSFEENRATFLGSGSKTDSRRCAKASSLVDGFFFSERMSCTSTTENCFSPPRLSKRASVTICAFFSMSSPVKTMVMLFRYPPRLLMHTLVVWVGGSPLTP